MKTKHMKSLFLKRFKIIQPGTYIFFKNCGKGFDLIRILQDFQLNFQKTLTFNFLFLEWCSNKYTMTRPISNWFQFRLNLPNGAYLANCHVHLAQCCSQYMRNGKLGVRPGVSLLPNYFKNRLNRHRAQQYIT